MSKELEALDWLNDALGYFLNKTTDTFCQLTFTREQATEFADEYKAVKQALQELQAIKEAKPSEALECLENLRQECKSTYFDENGKQWWTTDKNEDYRCNTIKQALLKAEKLEKAWEIEKEKNVDIYELQECKSVGQYNRKCDCWGIRLTEEEFELLKEMLE